MKRSSCKTSHPNATQCSRRCTVGCRNRVQPQSLFTKRVCSWISSVALVGNGRLPCLGYHVWTHVPEFAVSATPPEFDLPQSNLTFYFRAPPYIDGTRWTDNAPWLMQPLATATSVPVNLQTQHVWDDVNFPTFQTTTAANAKTDCGAIGDGFHDDYIALQHCVDVFDVVVLPKGFFRMSRTLVLSRDGGALVGVGRTVSLLLTNTSGFRGDVLLRVTATSFALHQLGYETFWHIPNVYLLDWQGRDGMWRQAHGIRTCDVLALTPRTPIG